jgi:hypothetical protein
MKPLRRPALLVFPADVPDVQLSEEPQQQVPPAKCGSVFFALSWLTTARPSCLKLLRQADRRAASRADYTAGNRRPTSVPMIAITTSSSTSVKPRRWMPRKEAGFITHLARNKEEKE